MQQPHLLPGHAGALRPPIEPVSPDTVQLVPHGHQATSVPDDSEVVEMTDELAPESFPLLGHRAMPISSAPFTQSMERTSEAALRRFKLDRPVATLGAHPEELEAEQLENCPLHAVAGPVVVFRPRRFLKRH